MRKVNGIISILTVLCLCISLIALASCGAIPPCVHTDSDGDDICDNCNEQMTENNGGVEDGTGNENESGSGSADSNGDEGGTDVGAGDSEGPDSENDGNQSSGDEFGTENNGNQNGDTNDGEGNDADNDNSTSDDSSDADNSEGEGDEGESEPQQIPQSSTGLAFVLNDDGLGYTCVSIGSCTQADIVIGCYMELPVTAIADRAFYDCDSVRSIKTYECLAEIGKDAFYNCDSLAMVDISRGTCVIGEFAFYDCDSLSDISLPSSVKQVDAYAFYSCDSLHRVSFDKGAELLSIGDYAFCECFALVDADLSAAHSLSVIGEYAFYNCYGLTSITIPVGVVEIGTNAFAACRRLVEVINQSSLPIYAGSKDYGRAASAALEVHSSETKIVNVQGFLFYRYGDINYLLEYVGDGSDIILPDSYNAEAYSLFKYAFYEADSIYKIGCNKQCMLSVIGEYSFQYCSRLASLELPSSLVSIVGGKAFDGCVRLVELINNSDLYLSESWIRDNGPDYLIEMHTGDSRLIKYGEYLFYPYESVINLVAYVGDDVLITLPDNCQGSEYVLGAFAIGEGVVKISANDECGLTKICDNSLYLCKNSLVSIEIPKSVKDIGLYAFGANNSHKLAEVINHSSLDITKGSYTYSNIAYYAFEVHKGESRLRIIGDDIFYVYGGTNYLVGSADTDATRILPEDCCGEKYVIAAYAFMWQTRLRGVVVPQNVTAISVGAFLACKYLEYVEISADVTDIGNGAFYGCEKITDVYYSGTEEQWDSIAVGANNEKLIGASIHCGS